MEIRERLREVAKKAIQYHREMYDELTDIQAEMQQLPTTEHQADIAYFMRKIGEHNKEVGKFLARVEQNAEKLCCLLWSQLDPDAQPVRTDYCTASPNVGMAFNIPHHKRDPEEYAAMMDWLGVPREHWEGMEEPTVSLRWNGIIERFNEAAKEGKPLPQGIDVTKQHPQYKLRIRKKLEITENPNDKDSEPPF